MDVTEIIGTLNPAQREAVTSADSHLLVLAGAGSGKTRALVHRISWLVEVEQVSPFSILAVTFTNKAAREMRQRIERLLGVPVGGMWVGTFHGLAHRLLQTHNRDAGLPDNFQILDSDDQTRVIKRLYQALDIDDSRWPVKQTQWFINAQKDEGLRARHLQASQDPFHRTMHRLYAAYEESCERGGMVDFGELLLRAHELWLNKPELLQHYQQRFRHILVDEFQDTNSVQYAWLRVLAGKDSRVTVVGDDDQSIYGWRGARIENILNFNCDFPDVKTVRLEQNYRSTQNILQAANAVIAKNGDRLGKNLWTEGPDGEPISLYAAFNEQDEARFITEQAKQWANKGNRWSDIGVLYRSNAQSRVLEDALIRAQLPYRIYGGHKFYERMEIRNALAYLRLLTNRQDDAAFERVINTPTRGIGEKSALTLRQLARDEGMSLWHAAEKAVAEKLFPSRAATAINGFLQLVDGLQQEVEGLPLHEQVEAMLQRTDLMAFHGREKGERGQARKENLAELVSACREFSAEDPERPALPQFLSEAMLNAGERQADSDQDAIQLMTLHSAKGLEFPLVFMAGMEENLFPHRMSGDEPGRLEEERRLAYVGVTRAMEKLFLSFAECRQLYGKDNYNAVSRFVRDIPAELVEEVRLSNQVRRPTSYAGGSSALFSDQGSGTGFDLGQRVMHNIFGEGTILNFEGNGPQARVQVNFDSEGSKWLVLSFAKLEPV